MKPRGSNELNTLVDFYSLTDSTDAAGGPVVTEAYAFHAMAKEEIGAAGEQATSDQDASFSRVVWWIRWRADVSTKMRARRDGELYDVNAADLVGRREWVRVVGEKVNDG